MVRREEKLRISRGTFICISFFSADYVEEKMDPEQAWPLFLFIARLALEMNTGFEGANMTQNFFSHLRNGISQLGSLNRP
jgi:hypothetical protein